MSLNKVQLIGNLTRDPEMKQIPGGQVVTTFSVATNLSWTDSSGQKQDKAEFHNVVAWRKLAEICGQYLKKGSKVYIEGRLQTRTWEAEDGSKRYRTEIVADNMIMLDKKGDAQSNQPTNNTTPQSTTNQKPQQQNTQSQNQAPQEPSNASGGNKPANPEDEVTIDDLPF
ncbi:single-stranded DNA-binding protein [Candidatus Peregrinibacteria bacterium]|nr:single-stranded DNA-binding protein [Candidatus Peregrinibacteria bacterium]